MADEKAKSQIEATEPGDTTAPVQPGQKVVPAREQAQPVKTDAPCQSGSSCKSGKTDGHPCRKENGKRVCLQLQ